MSKVSAFGIAVFVSNPQGGNQQSKSPVVIVQEMNNKLTQLGVNADDIITIQVEQDFYHVFYRENVE